MSIAKILRYLTRIAKRAVYVCMTLQYFCTQRTIGLVSRMSRHTGYESSTELFTEHTSLFVERDSIVSLKMA